MLWCLQNVSVSKRVVFGLTKLNITSIFFYLYHKLLKIFNSDTYKHNLFGGFGFFYIYFGAFIKLIDWTSTVFLVTV